MKFFPKLIDFLFGGIGSKIVDKVLAQFPDKMDEKEKAELESTILKTTKEYELQLIKLAHEEEKLALEEIKLFQDRIRNMEGTAKDLQQFGLIGKIIVFLRGCMRPIWCFAVLYGDYMVFSGNWNPAAIETKANTMMNLEAAFWIINFLVLGFLFGERAVRNAVPVFKEYQEAKKGSRTTTG